MSAARATWTPARIQLFRHALGETVQVFADRFGRSARTIEGWEQGKHRPDLMVTRAMDALDLAHRLECVPQRDYWAE